MSTMNQPYSDPPAAYCRHCGKPLREEDKRDVRGMIFCEDCLTAVVAGNVQRPVAQPAVAGAPVPASPALAFILGWIPGVGAMYNGQLGKGFAHVIILALLITLVSQGGIASVFFGLMIGAFVIYMALDAYQTARARQLGLPLPDPFGLNNLLGSAQSNSAPLGAVPEQSQSQNQGQMPPQYVPMNPAPSRQPTGALVLIGLGIFFLLANLGLINHYVTRNLWPAFLIGLGVWLFVRRQNAVQPAVASSSAGYTQSGNAGDNPGSQNAGDLK